MTNFWNSAENLWLKKSIAIIKNCKLARSHPIMSNITIQQSGIISILSDAIVNAANSVLQEGGGVRGAIFYKTGSDKLRLPEIKSGDCALDAGVISKERATESNRQFSKECQLASEIDGETS